MSRERLQSLGKPIADEQSACPSYLRGFECADADVRNWHKREALKYARLYSGNRYGEDPSRFYAAVCHLDRVPPLSPKPARDWLILLPIVRNGWLSSLIHR